MQKNMFFLLTDTYIGNGIDYEFHLSGYRPGYPNYEPFDKPCLTCYTYSLRNRNLLLLYKALPFLRKCSILF